MFCDAVSRLVGGFGTLECAGNLSPWPSFLALAVIVLTFVVMVSDRRFRSGRSWISATLTGLVAASLAIAAQQPRWVLPAASEQGQEGLLVALVDSSASLWRDPGSADAGLQLLTQRAEDIVDRLGPKTLWSGLVLQFAEGVQPVGTSQPVSRLPDMIRAVEPAFTGDETRGAAAIDAALARIREVGGRGAILLLSDGHFRGGLPERALQEARASGVAIHVLGRGSTAPGAGLIASDVGPEQVVGQDVVIRTAVLGAGRLTVSDGQGDIGLDVADAAAIRPARLVTRFAARGLRHVRLTFSGAGGKQERVLYTLVRGPARILTFGPAPWLDGLNPAEWIVERVDPMAPPKPGGFDLVVIDGVVPEDFPPGYDVALLKSSRRTGVFIVNGGLRGSVEDPQRIADWNDSALSPVLPVDSDPRKFIAEPPGRDIVILIDVSGSMTASLPIAQSVANAVLDELRPQDSVAILPFSDRPGHEFKRRTTSPAAIAQARSFIRALRVGGGTVPESTLRRAASMVTNYCAYFFISDGGFDPPNTSPLCYTTAISTEGLRFPQGVADWGEEILLRNGQGVSDLQMKYFEPEVRDAYFREGHFRPRATENLDLLTGIDLNGIAIAYPRIDADVISVHSAPPDPVLALRRDRANPGLAIAVFLGDIPASAPPDDIASILGRLTGWDRLERYDIRLRQVGDRLSAHVVLLDADNNGHPAASSISGQIQLENGQNIALTFRADSAPGSFVASVTLPSLDEVTEGTFILRESGVTPQVIPISLAGLPARVAQAGGTETFDFGIRQEVLSVIMKTTGGIDLSQKSPDIGRIASGLRYRYFYPWLILLAVTLLAMALWTEGRRK